MTKIFDNKTNKRTAVLRFIQNFLRKMVQFYASIFYVKKSKRKFNAIFLSPKYLHLDYVRVYTEVFFSFASNPISNIIIIWANNALHTFDSKWVKCEN